MGEDVDGKGQDGSTPLRCAVQVAFIIFSLLSLYLYYHLLSLYIIFIIIYYHY